MRATKAIYNFIGIAVGLGAAMVVSGCNPDDDADSASSSEGSSTGIPAEVAEQVDRITKRLEADAFSEANLRAKAEGNNADNFATQGTGVPDEVADEVDATSKRLKAESRSEGLSPAPAHKEGEQADAANP